MADDPDLELVRALQGGDDLALNSLMARHREPLFRFLYRYTRNETAARDLAQETFVRAYFGIHRFKPGARFATWLFQIGLNLCRDHARSKHVRRSRGQLSLESDSSPAGREPVDQGPSPGERAALADQLTLIEEAISRLPHDLKAALLLTAVEEYSHKDAAEMLGVTPKAVETRVYRARRFLTEMIDRD